MIGAQAAILLGMWITSFLIPGKVGMSEQTIGPGKQGHEGAPDGHRHKGVSAGGSAVHGLIAQLLSHKALQHAQ